MDNSEDLPPEIIDAFKEATNTLVPQKSKERYKQEFKVFEDWCNQTKVSNIKEEVIFGIGIPVEVQQQSITLGMVIKAYYQLPNNSSYYVHPSIDYEKKKRSATRWPIYEMIENYFDRNNYGDGKSCLLRSICQMSATPLDERTGILAEILHSILTPSSTNDEMDSESRSIYHDAEHLGKNMEDCYKLFPKCEVDLVQQFSKIMEEATIKNSLY